jgi:hypothetical protein
MKGYPARCCGHEMERLMQPPFLGVAHNNFVLRHCGCGRYINLEGLLRTEIPCTTSCLFKFS